MDETYVGGEDVADSPAADSGSYDASGPDPSTQVASDEARIPYSRFKEVIDQRGAYQARAAAAEQKAQQLETMMRSIAAAGRRGTLTNEEQAAVGAMKRLMQADPELAQLYQLRQQLPLLAQGFQTARQVQQQQSASIVANGQQTIGQLAYQSGLSTHPAALTHLENAIAGFIRSNPEAHARFRQGDPVILPWAFNQVAGDLIGPLAHQRNWALAQVKANTRNLTSPMRGGSPAGHPLFPKPQQGDERNYERDLHAAAMMRLSQLQEG